MTPTVADIARAESVRKAEEAAAAVFVQLLAGVVPELTERADATSIRRLGYLVELAVRASPSDEVAARLEPTLATLRALLGRIGRDQDGIALFGPPQAACNDPVAATWGLSRGLDLGRLRSHGIAGVP